MRKRLLMLFFLFFLAADAGFTATVDGNSYGSRFGKGAWQGIRNLLTAPLEIPIHFQEYHEKAGWPVARQTAGILEGIFRTVIRAEAGIWDLLAAPLPGKQNPLIEPPEF